MAHSSFSQNPYKISLALSETGAIHQPLILLPQEWLTTTESKCDFASLLIYPLLICAAASLHAYHE